MWHLNLKKKLYTSLFFFKFLYLNQIHGHQQELYLSIKNKISIKQLVYTGGLSGMEMISVNTNTVNLEQLRHKPYIGWWSDKRVVQLASRCASGNTKHAADH